MNFNEWVQEVYHKNYSKAPDYIESESQDLQDLDCSNAEEFTSKNITLRSILSTMPWAYFESYLSRKRFKEKVDFNDDKSLNF